MIYIEELKNDLENIIVVLDHKGCIPELMEEAERQMMEEIVKKFTSSRISDFLTSIIKNKRIKDFIWCTNAKLKMAKALILGVILKDEFYEIYLAMNVLEERINNM